MAHIRPIRTEDEPRVLALLRGLSDEDRRNPVMLSASGAVAVDARVPVAGVAPRRPLGARR